MKNNFIKQTAIYAAAFAVTLGAVSCSKLDEKVFGSKSIAAAAGGTSTADLASVYGALNGLVSQGNWYALQEHSTDELLGPTRGTDWDDFGTWRKIHLHAVDGAHNQLYDTWNQLNGALYQATLVAETGSGAAKAEGQFLRAFFASSVMDLFGQVPYRSAAAGPDDIPEVKTRAQAFDWIIADLDAAIAALPSYAAVGDNHKANKQAAQFLKARLLLNKAVYKANPATPAGPYTFDAADMNAVVTLVDAITASNKFSLTANYWDNFKWDNSTASSELIFSRGGSGAVNQSGGTINTIWYTAMGTHYNQAFSGWNGFTTTSDFYNSFASGDKRKSAEIPFHYDSTGLKAGFLEGQQFKPGAGGVMQSVKDRSGSPLVFTSDVSLFFSTESKGIRTIKYPLRYDQMGWNDKNDYVFFRYSDAQLMKAEAILRGASATGGQTALSIVNAIRTRSGASAMTAVALSDILAERGRELFLECVRRDDLIRFGKYNDPVVERAIKSDAFRVVYPIPNQAVSSNPNLKQNFGY